VADFSQKLAKRGTPIPFGLLLGQPGTVQAKVAGGADRFFSGVIWSMRKERADNDFDFYTVVLRPELDRLGHTKRTRLFQDMSALDIINQLLGPVGGSQNLITRLVPPRAYCAQYRETDLEFFLRLCSEEGITFYWLHLPLVSTLVLTDNTKLTAPAMTIPFDPLGGGTINDGARFTAWGFSQELCPTQVEVRDSHFQLAGMPLPGKAGAPSVLFGGGQPLRFPDAPGPWEEDNHSQARFIDGVAASGMPSLIPPIAGVLDEMQRSAAGRLVDGAVGKCVRSQGSGYCPLVAPGLGFILTECGDQNGPYVATRVEHRVEMQGRYYAGEASELALRSGGRPAGPGGSSGPVRPGARAISLGSGQWPGRHLGARGAGLGWQWLGGHVLAAGGARGGGDLRGGRPRPAADCGQRVQFEEYAALRNAPGQLSFRLQILHPGGPASNQLQSYSNQR